MENERHRLDVWLKLVCLFKHRTEATEACRGGHVKLNSQRVKPAAVVKAGDVVEFYQGEHLRRLVVSGLPAGSISKEVARTMYVDESPAPVKPDEMTNVYRERGAGRPTKRDRRDMEKLRR
jgi:ribosome-associated heat shock protein Hsp15